MLHYHGGRLYEYYAKTRKKSATRALSNYHTALVAAFATAAALFSFSPLAVFTALWIYAINDVITEGFTEINDYYWHPLVEPTAPQNNHSNTAVWFMQSPDTIEQPFNHIEHHDKSWRTKFYDALDFEEELHIIDTVADVPDVDLITLFHAKLYGICAHFGYTHIRPLMIGKRFE